MDMLSQKESIRKSILKAGYERASCVYEGYCEDRAELISDRIKENAIETLEDLEDVYLKYYLPNGQPRPSYMKEHDWPDNMNQIFCDNYSSVEIDSSIFTINNYVEKINLINSFFDEDEAWDIVFDGAEEFISDKYDSEYLSLND